MSTPRFVLDPPTADAVDLSSLVAEAKPLARPPISDFHVGAVGLGSSGRIFFGVNLEFPSLPLHQSVHAEQFLITNLALHRESTLLSFAVSAAPCGHCRQFLQELRSSSDVQILVTDTHSTFRPLSELLPQRFGPCDLLPESTPLLLETRFNRLSLIQNPNFPNRADLIDAALDAANRSHAPYSDSPSGVALLDGNGVVFRGSYMESAAYNPSMGPVQAAIVAYIVGGGGGYEGIKAAVLVEKGDAKVKQEATARLLLETIAPECEFLVVHCGSI